MHGYCGCRHATSAWTRHRPVDLRDLKPAALPAPAEPGGVKKCGQIKGAASIRQQPLQPPHKLTWMQQRGVNTLPAISSRAVVQASAHAARTLLSSTTEPPPEAAGPNPGSARSTGSAGSAGPVGSDVSAASPRLPEEAMIEALASASAAADASPRREARRASPRRAWAVAVADRAVAMRVKRARKRGYVRHGAKKRARAAETSKLASCGKGEG